MPLPHFTIAAPPPAPAPAPATSTSTSSKTPTSSNNPGSASAHDISSARTPPATVTTFAGSASYTSPSSRTRLPDRDLISPGLRNPYPQGERPDRPPPPQQHSERFGTVTVPSAAEHTQPTFSPFPADLLPPSAVTQLTSKVSTDSRPSTDILESFNEPQLHGPLSPDSNKGLKPPPHNHGHSRSGSSSSIGERLRNLNRWSVLSASSKGSNGGGSSWRIGKDSGKQREDSLGGKSHKRRPSTSEISPRSVSHLRGRSDSPLLHPIPPLPSLPRISAGPSLEEEFRHQASEIGRQSPTPPRRYYLRPPPDDNTTFWDGAPQIPEDTPGSLPRSRQAEGLLPPAELAPDHMMPPYTQNGDPRGQSRGRSHGGRPSTDSTTASRPRDRDRARRERPPSQKAMLSDALAKANAAVQLDNAQAFEEARLAYTEACQLLQRVLERTSTEEDRRKLEAIVGDSRATAFQSVH